MKKNIKLYITFFILFLGTMFNAATAPTDKALGLAEFLTAVVRTPLSFKCQSIRYNATQKHS